MSNTLDFLSIKYTCNIWYIKYYQHIPRGHSYQGRMGFSILPSSLHTRAVCLLGVCILGCLPDMLSAKWAVTIVVMGILL